MSDNQPLVLPTYEDVYDLDTFALKDLEENI
jgi:hypothetical protein